MDQSFTGLLKKSFFLKQRYTSCGKERGKRYSQRKIHPTDDEWWQESCHCFSELLVISWKCTGYCIFITERKIIISPLDKNDSVLFWLVFAYFEFCQLVYVDLLHLVISLVIYPVLGLCQKLSKFFCILWKQIKQ